MTPTNAAESSGMGWSNGIACQVSLPNTSLLHCRGPVSRRQFLVQYGSEKTGLDASIGVGFYILRLTQQPPVRGVVQYGAVGTRPRGPVGEIGGRHGLHLEMHVGETIAAEVRGQALI